ncbi:MAG TPA: TlyA family RNA methyltransferase [Methylomirabilota bacterium]|nr:TlyA family RNA methyltransferase [Methylomirabilota bacterium]
MKKSLAKKPNPGSARPAPGRTPVGGQAKVKERIDVALVSRGLAPTREKAARLLLAGAVLVDGRRVDKPGVLVAPGAELKVTARQKFVSRGGDKLAHALAAFRVEPKGRVCVDVGASTGGFTHCLLENGAARVYAVDVGQGQLDASLRADGRVVVMEKTNARQLTPEAFPDPPSLATIDISFISLEKVLSPVFTVLTPDGEAIALVKPQFEIGKGLVGKGGVVRDAAHHKTVVSRVARYCVLHGWHARGVAVSPLKGPKGNREFFLHLTRTGRTAADLDELITRAVETPEPE